MGDVLAHLVCILLLWDVNLSVEMFLTCHCLYDGFVVGHLLNDCPQHLCNYTLMVVVIITK